MYGTEKDLAAQKEIANPKRAPTILGCRILTRSENVGYNAEPTMPS